MCQALRKLMKDEIAEEMKATEQGGALKQTKKTASNMLREEEPMDKIARVLELQAGIQSPWFDNLSG